MGPLLEFDEDKEAWLVIVSHKDLQGKAFSGGQMDFVFQHQRPRKAEPIPDQQLQAGVGVGGLIPRGAGGKAPTAEWLVRPSVSWTEFVFVAAVTPNDKFA